MTRPQPATSTGGLRHPYRSHSSGSGPPLHGSTSALSAVNVTSTATAVPSG
jgi:hypothetical protein